MWLSGYKSPGAGARNWSGFSGRGAVLSIKIHVKLHSFSFVPILMALEFLEWFILMRGFLFAFYNNLATLIRRQIVSFGFFVNIWTFALGYRQSIQKEAWDEKNHITWFVSVWTTKAHLLLQVHCGATVIVKYEAMTEFNNLLQTVACQSTLRRALWPL